MSLWGARDFLPRGGVTQAAIAAALRDSYGTGVDGDLTVAGTRTETTHRAYVNLVVPASQILQPEGFIVAARRKITIAGTIRRNGNNAAGATAGGTIASNAFGSSFSGAQNGTTTVGGSASGSTTVPLYGGTGGNGGAGVSGAGGTSATFTCAVTAANLPEVYPWCLLNFRFGSFAIADSLWSTGQGGSGGGGSTASSGGGGGSAAGAVILMAPVIELASTAVLQAIGGNGANGVATDCGGGGGGGGGTIILLCQQLIDAGATFSVAGGTKGLSGGGAGVDGTNGGAGKVFKTGIF